jgi:hypothetical protein
MAKNPDKLSASLESENTGGVLSGLLADEDEFDRRALWRLGSWAVGAVAAVTVAMLANQSSIGWRREQVASADLIRQSQQLQTVAKESQNEAKRLASAVDTLNSDRDRLYSRLSVLEQGLDSVTGALAKQNGAAATPASAVPAASATPATTAASTATAAPAETQKPPPAPPVLPVATTAPSPATPPALPPAPSVAAAAPPEKPAMAATTEKPPVTATVPDPAPATVSSLSTATTNPPTASNPAPLMASKSMIGPPDPAAAKLEPNPPPKTTVAATAPASPASKPEVVASAPPAAANEEPEAAEAPSKVHRTEFGVDVGGANSVGGLRALWRGLLKSRANAPLAALRPIIMVKESNTGLGMQLRLVAGPLNDAAAAAKICAGMTANDRPCETTVFDGQRLTINGDDPPPAAAATTTSKPTWHYRHGSSRHMARDEPQAKKPDPTPAAPAPAPSAASQAMSLIFGR